VERLRQNSGSRGLAHAPRPNKEISMREAVLLDSILERTRDVRLPNEIVEGLGAIFPGEDFVAHIANLNAVAKTRKQKFKFIDRINRIVWISLREQPRKRI